MWGVDSQGNATRMIAMMYVLKSCRIEMKKFLEHKPALSMLKLKMGMKSKSSEGYSNFVDELDTLLLEGAKFYDTMEYCVAVAESTDPATVSVFQNSSIVHLQYTCIYTYTHCTCR